MSGSAPPPYVLQEDRERDDGVNNCDSSMFRGIHRVVTTEPGGIRVCVGSHEKEGGNNDSTPPEVNSGSPLTRGRNVVGVSREQTPERQEGGSGRAKSKATETPTPFQASSRC